MQCHSDFIQERPALCFISEYFACPSACLSDHPSAVVFSMMCLSYLASLLHGPPTPFLNLQSVSISWIRVLPDTPAKWLLHLGLNVSSHDLSQKQNNPEKFSLRTLKMTERMGKADNARNLLENISGTLMIGLLNAYCIYPLR